MIHPSPYQQASILVDEYFSMFNHSCGLQFSIECALKCVNQIILSRKDDAKFDDREWAKSSDYHTPHPMYLSYWVLVQEELKTFKNY